MGLASDTTTFDTYGPGGLVEVIAEMFSGVFDVRWE